MPAALALSYEICFDYANDATTTVCFCVSCSSFSFLHMAPFSVAGRGGGRTERRRGKICRKPRRIRANPPPDCRILYPSARHTLTSVHLGKLSQLPRSIRSATRKGTASNTLYQIHQIRELYS